MKVQAAFSAATDSEGRGWQRVSKKIWVRRTAQTAMALALVAGFSAMANAQARTHTTLTAETRDLGGKTIVGFTGHVTSDDGSTATGAVRLVESGHDLAGTALASGSEALFLLDGLKQGDHSIQAVYDGDADHAPSTSEAVTLHPLAAGSPDFSIGIAPASLSMKAGSNGNSTLTLLPVNGFTGFITLSCSGLPVGASCTFTPANLQMTATTSPTAGVTAQLSLVTTAPAGQNGKLELPSKGSPMALAILLPGVIGLGVLGRKRNLLGRISLLVLVAGLGIMATTACNPRYYYLNHPPTYNGGTPKGTYTITVTAQSSNGVTATAHSTPLALTVQ